MPELPELEVLRERLEQAISRRRVIRADALHPFLLRTVDPPLPDACGRTVRHVERRGKRIRVVLDGDLALEMHLMRAGRLRLRSADGYRPHRRRTMFAMEVEGNVLVEMTEAGTERRAWLRVLRLPDAGDGDAGELEPLSEEFTLGRFAAALRRENRQLKGALRSRDVVAGVGNAYADEILHAARLPPLRLTSRLADDEIERLHIAVGATLREWIDRVRAACPPGSLPERQDRWRSGFRVHGRPGEPCPACGDRIERISYRDSETHYCPACQNDGRTLADRRLSRLGIRPARRPRPRT